MIPTRSSVTHLRSARPGGPGRKCRRLLGAALVLAQALVLAPSDARAQAARDRGTTVWEEAAAMVTGGLEPRTMELADLVARQDLETAVTLAREILETNPMDPAALHVVRLHLFQLGEFEQLLSATRECRPSEHEQERSCEFYRALALARVGRQDEAIELLSATVQFADGLPGAAWYRSNLAELLLWRGDVRLAGMLYGRALAQQPNLVSAHAGQVAVALLLGDVDRARSLFMTAWAATEDDPSSRELAQSHWAVDGIAQLWGLLVGQVNRTADLALLEQAVRSSELGGRLEPGVLDALVGQPVSLLGSARVWDELPCLATRAALSPDGRSAALACAAGEVWEAAVEDGRPTGWTGVQRSVQGIPVADLAWSTDGRLWVLQTDGTLLVWQRGGGPAVVHELPAAQSNAYGEALRPVSLSPTGDAALLAGDLYAYELRCVMLGGGAAATMNIFEYDSVMQPVIDGGCRRAAWISGAGVVWGSGSSRESSTSLSGQSIRGVSLDSSGGRLYVGTSRRVLELESGAVRRWIEQGTPVVDLMATDVATLVVTTSEVLYWPRESGRL